MSTTSDKNFEGVDNPVMAPTPGWYEALRVALFQFDPEEAHKLAVQIAPIAAGWIGKRVMDKRLRTSVAGIELENPIGLAAGFDKNGHLTGCLSGFGFGFAEVGSITGQSTGGNPKPRLFRLVDDEAVINRLGLNGDGADAVSERLAVSQFSIPIGINIAKTNLPAIKGELAVQDMLHSFSSIKDLPVSFVTLNVSCPNTHEGILKETEELDQILAGVVSLNSRGLPIFLKLSPDSSQTLLESSVASANRFGVKGFILGNTTTTRAGLVTAPARVTEMGMGGLSGPPLKSKALDLVKNVYRLKSVEQQIIGCGGVSSGADAYEFIRQGASAVELYTALIYGGPDLPLRMLKELLALLERDQLDVQAAVGSAHR